MAVPASGTGGQGGSARGPVARIEFATPPVSRPLLRGYSHAGAAIIAVFATVTLLRLTAGDPPKQLSMLVYGASTVLLFTISASFHLGPWSTGQRMWLRRLDRTAIFVLIAGTYTPALFNLLEGWWRVGLLVTVWALAALGMVTVAPALHLPRQLVVALYVALSLIPLIALPRIVAGLGMAALFLPVTGGILHIAGALAYVLRRPRLWPRVFGYHEVFHLAVIAASALIYVFMVQYVVPVARP